MASKIFITGAVNGQLSAVFEKIGGVHAKHNFAFIILTGDLFADESTQSNAEAQDLVKLLNGGIEIPAPTYFAIGKRPLPQAVVEKLTSNEGELCPNLYALGRKTMVKTSEGFKIIAIGGTHVAGEDAVMDEYSSTYTDKDVASAQNYQNADILITSDWPAEVRDGSKVAFDGENPVGAPSISELCAALKPRHHISTSQSQFVREPFFHPEAAPQPITYFTSLAPFPSDATLPKKQKWQLAISMEPSAAPKMPLPANCTASPFVKMTARKRKAEEPADETQNGFRFANGNDYDNRGHNRHRKRRKEQPTLQQCFFCLKFNEREAHMVASLGEHAYITIAKGPLPTNRTFSDLGHPLHMLIMPVEHTPTLAAIPDPEVRKETVGEMQKYRDALHNMIAIKSTRGGEGEAQLGAVTWEISRAGGMHLHWQFLPVPVDLVKRRLVEVGFDVEAENLSYPKFVKDDTAMEKAQEGDYLKVMIWSESTQKEMVLPLEHDFRFDLQYPRRVLAKLLKLESRSNWRDVAQEQAEEEVDKEAFVKMFGPYDTIMPQE